MSFVEKAAVKAVAKGLKQEDVQKISDQKAKAAFVLLIIACGMWYFAQTPFAALPLIAAAFVGAHAFFKSEVSSKMIDLSMKTRP
jgi:hypothetical protein